MADLQPGLGADGRRLPVPAVAGRRPRPGVRDDSPAVLALPGINDGGKRHGELRVYGQITPVPERRDFPPTTYVSRRSRTAEASKGPNTSSLSYTLCARQRTEMLSTVAGPWWPCGCRWCSSR